ncbi:hypothetical protein MELB17_24097 [Marinobacter sp. ELB17]|jgi:hypothetical protein|nr:hypothetical protein MELB17_24097 [Marinobacter sp. ELB17]
MMIGEMNNLLQPQFLVTTVISVLVLLYSLVARRQSVQERNRVKALALVTRQWEGENYSPERIAWLDRHAGRPSVMDD